MSIRVFSVQPVAVPPVQTLSNGLTLLGTNGVLGGSLVGSTTLDINTQIFTISDVLNTIVQQLVGGQYTVQAGSIATNNFGLIQVAANFVFLQAEQDATHKQIITLGGGGAITVTDSELAFGLVYATNYAALGVTSPRWIPDYGAVTAAITAAVPAVTANNGLTDTVAGQSHTIKLGGPLTGNTTVTVQPGQTLLFVDSLGRSEILLSPNQVIIEGFNSFIQLSVTSMTVQDGNNATGLLYVADYSAIGLTLNRWIPDLGGVKAYVASLQMPVTVGRNHSNGLSVGTFLLVSFVVGGTSAEFRVNGSYTFRTGAGSVAIQIIWTDTGGTVNNKTPQSKAAAGSDYLNPGCLYANAGSTITVNAVVTGTAIGDFSVTVEQIF